MSCSSPTPSSKESAPPATPKGEPWGRTKDGQAVGLYTLTNSKGMEARITTYGAIVVSLKVPSAAGKVDDVVLGFDSLDGYTQTPPHPYFGAVVGRYGNRIAKGRFKLDGVEYKLAVVAAGDAPRVLYSSDPGLRTDDVSSFDSIMYIFGSADAAQRPSLQPVKHTGNSQEPDWRRFSGPVWFPVIQYASHVSPWALMIQHRTGPVAAIARSVWNWNLLIGGVVLVLLAANIGLVIFSSHRVQKLAKLQLHFVAAVSHELLSPLSAMYCTGQNAKDGLVQTKEDVITHGSIITSQSRQLIDLVKQNLLFAATESGTKRYTSNPLQVSELIESVRKDLKMLAEESGANIECKIQPALPSVMGYLSALTQCLQNLVANAIKYGGKGGSIAISASLHETQNDSAELQISVQDHGPGINSSDLRHVFEPFYRSPKVVDAQIHGTGLGLTVADRIAKAMGGRLSVTSEVGLGSTFILHLPVRKVDTKSAATIKEAIQGQT